ncbi:50S ribosomal protein L23 [archaeon]|nr:50S ribosomal protein L23 [archaeon]|tara:strand:- start:2893 stop:3162 length:270 start_codon:yes stop_codon:yes gene_type:complete
MKNKDPYSIIKNPISTEKAVRIMETDNKLTFVVNRKSTKSEIKKSLEDIYSLKITKVNTAVTNKGIKKAYIKLPKDVIALDIATQIGIM